MNTVLLYFNNSRQKTKQNVSNSKRIAPNLLISLDTRRQQHLNKLYLLLVNMFQYFIYLK